MLDNDSIDLWTIYAREIDARAVVLEFFIELSKKHARRDSLLIFIDLKISVENSLMIGKSRKLYIRIDMNDRWERFVSLHASPITNDPINEFRAKISRQTRAMGLETGKFDLLPLVCLGRCHFTSQYKSRSLKWRGFRIKCEILLIYIICNFHS